MNKSRRDELQKRYDGLESTAMHMAAQGLSIPAEVSDELLNVRKELDSLGPSVKIKSWTDWLGFNLKGYTIKERISSGSYSNVFRAVNGKTKEQCAFKISKSDKAIEPEKCFFSKQAIAMNNELNTNVELSGNFVLEAECERLQMDMSGAFVPVLTSGYSGAYFFYQMPFLQGQSLKELISLPDMPFLQYATDVFSRLCTILERLDARHYHGNLQPDNIFISKTDIKLLSPGAFELSNKTATNIMLSTPAYYPFYESNDLVALGITFWEAILKGHPFAVSDCKERPDQFADELREMLEYRKSLNHDPLWQILKLATPKDLRSDISDKTEQFLMKAIKLAFQSDGLITGSPGFKKPSEFNSDLQQLANSGFLRPV